MYGEYRQRYQNQLLRVTVLGVTPNSAWVLAAISNQWAFAAITQDEHDQVITSQVDPAIVQLIRLIAKRLLGFNPDTSMMPDTLKAMVTALSPDDPNRARKTFPLTLIRQPAGTSLDFWSLGEAAFLTVPDQRLQPADLRTWLVNLLPHAHGVGFGPVTDRAALAVMALDHGRQFAAGSSPEVAVVLADGRKVATYHLDAAQVSDAGYRAALEAAKQNQATVRRFFANEV
ncbi:hypothetical protein BVJ53_01820 [Lacticaseibacillus chiayiensis]|uniref:Uncharacterized protein n=1 Tax=Lacticaseibacillus chiayiensis TaxID=2100821 RepID=A0A4Q1UEY6_9LACO|nr:hypothetical protein [Lacticaseibacillus chiayiensis]QVI35802.1 hypothetical protein KG086_05770 [Lacticaseibacillus chiayiensis]RXT30291.1 hypothetical protein BVJ53_01820 [Lacticaseibacillus chiayiensis]RXT59203.1 hypothetical protein CHT97_02035 [Lacticaseibacillus chiayiensis]UYN57639.1 hypothetical protein OFW50_06115 [Lacticaseibacillus chiayiensis]